MKRQDAIRALLRAGKQDDLTKTIGAAGAAAQAKFEAIRNDAGRSDEHKRWALAVASNQARLSLEQQLTQLASTAVTADRDDAERVFGTKGLNGDPASLVISRRDAGDRVARIEDSADLRDLLARATRSGDEVLARAVAERAVQLQDDLTMHAFLDDRPALDAAGERLWNAERAATGTMAVSVQLAELRPEEMALASFEHIEQAAQEPEPGAVSAVSA